MIQRSLAQRLAQIAVDLEADLVLASTYSPNESISEFVKKSQAFDNLQEFFWVNQYNDELLELIFDGLA